MDADSTMEAMLGSSERHLHDGESFLCPVVSLTFYKNDDFKRLTGRDQPYSILPKEKLEQLQDSIRSSGLLEALTVREDPNEDGKYQILAGRNRYLAISSGNLMDEIPCVYRECPTEDDARKILIETNEARREKVSDLERAFSVAFRMDSIKELNKDKQLGAPSDEIVGREFGISPTSVHNCVQITKLIPDFQDMLEKGNIGIITGAHIGSMPTGLQEAFWGAIDENKKLTDKTVKKVSEAAKKTDSGLLSVLEVEELLSRPADLDKPKKVKIPDEYRELVPNNEEMEDFFVDNWIKNAIRFYAETLAKRNRVDDEDPIPEGQIAFGEK